MALSSGYFSSLTMMFAPRSYSRCFILSIQHFRKSTKSRDGFEASMLEAKARPGRGQAKAKGPRVPIQVIIEC